MEVIKRVDARGKVGRGKDGKEKGVLNRRVLEDGVIRTVVFDLGTPAWIKNTSEDGKEVGGRING